MKKIFVFFMLGVLFYSGCSKKNTRVILTEDEYYNHIITDYKNGKYLKFSEDTKYFFSDFPASKYAPYVQYLIGKFHYERKEYEEAIVAFQRVIDKYPDSPYLEDAYMGIANCYYAQRAIPQRDQENTKRAIYYYNKVLALNSSKFTKEARDRIEKCREILAEKEYYIAHYYYKVNNYKISNEILDRAVASYGDTPVAFKLYLLKGYNYYYLKDKDKAFAMLKMAKTHLENYKNIKEAEKDIKKLKEKIEKLK